MQTPDLTTDKILELEFNYVKDTASQAIDDRYKLLNFYIAIATFVATIAIGAFTLSNVSQFINLQTALVALCILISLIGWIFVAMMVRLRQAWHESMQAMNRIKEYYQSHTGTDNLNAAFLWNHKSIPQRHRLWNIHFYSALLIIMIDSAFLAAGLLVWGINPLGAALIVAVSFVTQISIYRLSLYRNI